MFNRKKKSESKEKKKTDYILGREDSTTLHRGRAEAIELIEKCDLTPEVKKFFRGATQSLPEKAFIIKFKNAAIPWAPEDTILRKDGIKDCIKKEASYDTLSAVLILVLAAIGKIKEKEPVATLEAVWNGRRMHVSVVERKVNVIGKLLKVKVERKVKVTFQPYTVERGHKPTNVSFGKVEEIEHVPVVKIMAPEQNYQMAAM